MVSSMFCSRFLGTDSSEMFQSRLGHFGGPVLLWPLLTCFHSHLRSWLGKRSPPSCSGPIPDLTPSLQSNTWVYHCHLRPCGNGTGSHSQSVSLVRPQGQCPRTNSNKTSVQMVDRRGDNRVQGNAIENKTLIRCLCSNNKLVCGLVVSITIQGVESFALSLEDTVVQRFPL